MALSSNISLNVAIDWALDDNPSDESSYARRIGIVRGRSASNDAPAPGSGSLVLRNRDGRFSPFNTASPIYPNVLPGRPIVITIDYDGVTYPLFAGYATPTFPTRGIDSEITLNLVDEFDKWSKPPLTNTDLSTDVLISDLMIETLDDINFDALKREIDESENSLAYWTNHNRLPLNALRLLAKENLGGLIFMRGNGDFRFENLSYRSKQGVDVRLEGTFETLEPDIRFDDLVDSARSTYPRFIVASEEMPAYSLNPVGKFIPPGLTVFSVDFAGLGASGAIEPVPVTDYTANSQPDGTGTDKTAQLVVDSFLATGGGATITLQNLDTIGSYLTYFQIRAFLVQSGNETNEIVAETSNPVVAYNRFTTDFEFQNDDYEIQAYTEYQAERLGRLTARATVQIVPDTDSRMEDVLGADISTRVELVDVGAPWLTQLDRHFFIEQLQIEIDAMQLNKVTATWLLFDERLAEGDGFIINDDAPVDTWPESFIADDADIEGRVIFK